MTRYLERFELETSNLACRLTTEGTNDKNKQVAQLSQRDRATGGLVMAKSGRLELGDNIY